jgi:spore maturation protein CgeB
VPWLNNPVEMTKKDMDNYGCDVVFIGHYEADRRVTLLESVVRSGWKLRLFGPGYDWDPIVRRSRELSSQVPVRMVWGEDYNKALSGARVALCFLSKLNRDTYTRRCFEIPATRALMLSEYTDDLATLFREGEEADFFRNPEELITKIKIYITDDRRRRTVAEAGFNKVYNDGHDVISRMRQVLVWANKTKGYAN